MGEPILDRYLGRITETFKKSKEKHQAHSTSQPILREMSEDAAVLPAIFRRHLETPGTWHTRHYPVVTMRVALNPDFALDANCWITLPSGEVNISTKAIHHHGDMLLSTVTAFGPGYEHWTFHRPVSIDANEELFSLKLKERAAHPLHHVAFVDSDIPHLPMYPPSLSITLALWSSRKKTTWKDHVKRVPLLKKNEVALKAFARKVGMAKTLDLKVVEYFDFYPTDAGFKGMRERIEFGRGPNEDYLQSLFHILQRTGNEGLAPVIRRRIESGARWDNDQLIRQLLGDLEEGRSIEGRLSDGHYGVPHANFTSDDIERALAMPRTLAPTMAGGAH